MARPTKITNEKKLRLADFVRSGLTIKDACYGVGISTSTFNRLRAKDADFDKLIIEATEGGWTNAGALAKYHYRGYKRKNPPKRLISPKKPLIETPSIPPRHYKANTDSQKTYLGLPVRFTYPEQRPSDFYYNGNTNRVERFTKDGILQTMSPATWERKYLHRETPSFIGLVI